MTTDPLTFPTTKTFGALVIEINTGTHSTPVWSAPCGFDTKAFNRGATTSTANVPPCNNPDGAAQQVTAITGKTKQVQGSGVLSAGDAPMWSAWHESGAPMEVRVRLTGIEYFVGPAVLSSFNITGAKGQNAELLQHSVTIDQAATWTQTTGDPS